MNRCDVALFEKHANRMLRELGYEVGQMPVSRAALGFRYLKTLAGRQMLKGRS